MEKVLTADDARNIIYSVAYKDLTWLFEYIREAASLQRRNYDIPYGKLSTVDIEYLKILGYHVENVEDRWIRIFW